jgi:hypothetical protein
MRPVSDKRIFDHDPVFGITEYWHPSEDGDAFTLEVVQDAEPVVEFNKKAQAEWQGKRWGDGLQHVAQIPMNIYWDLKNKGILNDQVALRRWLNDPDNRFFRTKTGVI